MRAGIAWHYKDYQGEQTPPDGQLYANAQNDARAAKIGLWIDLNPIPSWDFRRLR
ncbi:MAG: thermonuclease family protein [Acidobacteria bacterium]|nr:thermonuclease family protein [Acidobacteriota bacterium]MCA1627669.1 thermonuclease family protein [Acidobacteriota bacterium]